MILEPDDDTKIVSFFSSSRLFVAEAEELDSMVVEFVVVVIAAVAIEAEFEIVGGAEALLDALLLDEDCDDDVITAGVTEEFVETTEVAELVTEPELTVGTKDVSIIAFANPETLVVSLLLLFELLLFTFDEDELLLLLLVLVVRVFVVFVRDFVQSGSWASSFPTMSQFCILIGTVIVKILAVVELFVDEVFDEDEDAEDPAALLRSRPDFCCCSRCNRVVTPVVSKFIIHWGWF